MSTKLVLTKDLQREDRNRLYKVVQDIVPKTAMAKKIKPKTGNMVTTKSMIL